MAPKRRGARKQSDRLHFPLMYSFNSAGASQTTVETLAQTFDRRRAFRISGFFGEIAAFKYPITIQFEVFNPVSATDVVYATPSMVVPAGGLRRFRHRIPASISGWFPSETATTTPICRLVNICTDKATMGGLKGSVTIVITLGPFEPTDTCPQLQPYTELRFDDGDSEASTSANPRN